VDVGDASTAVVWINGDFMSFVEAGVANTKIRLANSGGAIGIGVQSGQLRLHHNAAASRTSFLDAAAGNEIFSVGGDSGGGVRWYDRGAEPSCVAGQLGRVRFDDAATDTFKICMDNGAGLAWVNIVGTTNHDILSATHGDTTTATAVRGDLMIANATPAWDRVAVGANGSFLKSNGTDPAWSNDIEGGDVGAGTTHPAGSTIVRVLRHNTNCQSITDGKDGEMCWDTDDNRIYVCEPTAGDCSGTEWEQITDNDSGGTPAWEALINSADTATTYDSTAVAETVDFDFQAAYTTGNLFTIRGTTGNPTGGTLLNVQSHDAQLAIANFWDGTNGVQVSAAGAMNAVGSGSIDADTLTMAAGTALTVDNELHFVEEVTGGQPTCTTGAFWIWADDTLNKIRGCDDGTLYDLNTAGGAAHDLLGTTHSDTLTAAVSRGSIVVGNVTPAWSELVIGGANTVLGSDGTDATWTALAKAHLPSAIAYEDEANTFTATQTIGTGGILTTSGTGFIRLPNASWLVGRNFANTADVNLLRLTTSDEIFIGDSGMAVVWIGGDFLSFSEGGFANQKIRLATGAGLGVQSGQTRIHHNGTTARTTFLDGVAGNDIFEVGGEAGGGVQWFDRGAEPACVAAELGRVRLDDAATDTFKVCMDDGGGLAWVSLAVDEFDELIGTVGDTQIAAGAVDGGAAGEIADNSVTTEDLEATLQDFTVSIAIESPTTGQSFLYQWETPHQCTMQEIQCNTKGASTTATINFDERARTTPDTAGTTVATTDLICDTDGQNTTTFSNAAIAANVPVALEIVAVSGTAPDVVRIHARCRRD
jgi:hypothetical protein